MNENIFKNSGKKIQKMATIVFWLEFVSSLILAFALGWDRHRYYSEFRAGVFFAFLIGGPLVSYCSALVLYAFGELVEKASAICSWCYQSASSVAKKEEEPAICAYDGYTEDFVKQETGQEEITEAEAIPCDDPNFIKCPSCGCVQEHRRNVCWNCGLRFVKAAETK